MYRIKTQRDNDGMTVSEKWLREDGGGRGANLAWHNLYRANLAGADFARAYLYKSELSFSILTNANLTESIIDKADISWANLAGAKLTRASFFKSDLYGANLTGATLTESRLTMSRLAYANLTDATLCNAQLDNTILYMANLRGANLAGAKLNLHDALQIAFTDRELIAIAMQIDAANHPDPESFDRWAAHDDCVCPFSLPNSYRLISGFEPDKTLWKPGKPKMSLYEFWLEVAASQNITLSNPSPSSPCGT